MRAIWKGFISFGLINIPIELYSAEKKAGDVHFKLLDSRNHAKIRYERINEETGEEVPWSDVVKAYEYDDEKFVILEPEDFARVAIENSQTIAVEDFVSGDDLDCTYFEKPYYLLPGKKGEKGYVLLRETLRNTNTVAIAKVVIRTRQYLAAVIVKKDAMVMNLLRFPQEIKKLSEFEFPKGGLKEHHVSQKELEMAERLVESMTVKWQPEKYHDDYRDALMKWIEKKAKAKGIVKMPPAPEAPKETKVIDFMELLKKSLKKRDVKTTKRKTKVKPVAKKAASSRKR